VKWHGGGEDYTCGVLSFQMAARNMVLLYLLQIGVGFVKIINLRI